jgi:hypothetical protein
LYDFPEGKAARPERNGALSAAARAAFARATQKSSFRDDAHRGVEDASHRGGGSPRRDPFSGSIPRDQALESARSDDDRWAAEGSRSRKARGALRRFNIFSAEIDRPNVAGTVGLSLTWRKETLPGRSIPTLGSLTTVRVSLDLNLKTRTRRIKEARSYFFALGREVGSRKVTDIRGFEDVDMPIEVPEAVRDEDRLPEARPAPAAVAPHEPARDAPATAVPPPDVTRHAARTAAFRLTTPAPPTPPVAPQPEPAAAPQPAPEAQPTAVSQPEPVVARPAPAAQPEPQPEPVVAQSEPGAPRGEPMPRRRELDELLAAMQRTQPVPPAPARVSPPSPRPAPQPADTFLDRRWEMRSNEPSQPAAGPRTTSAAPVDPWASEAASQQQAAEAEDDGLHPLLQRRATPPAAVSVPAARAERPAETPRTDTPPPGWYPDPTGRAELRYWDGRWTAHVKTDGRLSLAPLSLSD